MSGESSPGKGLARLWRKLTSSTDQIESDSRQQVVREEGATPISVCADRELVTLRGTVASVTLNPRTGMPWLEVELHDGSGSVSLVWMGRRSIPGVMAGRQLRVQGRISCVDGRRRLFNPKYELIPVG